MNKVEMAVRDILNKYSESDVVFDMIDEVIPEYVRDWEDEFDSIYEAYEEQGRGEAERQVLDGIINEYAKDKNIEFSTDEVILISHELEETWGM